MNDVERRKATADLLSSIASYLYTVDEILVLAVQASGPEKDALIVAAGALVNAAGQLADRTASAHGGCGTKDADSWIHPPSACAAVKLLEAARAA